MSRPHDDPFAALEEAARRQVEEEKALKAVTAARARLVLGTEARSVFFASLVLRLNVRVDWATETMAVDGKTLFVNPSFVKGLTPDETVGVLVHETWHVAGKHHCRREGRDPRRWNTAADLSANSVLEQAGFVLPKGRLMVGEGEYQDLPPDKSAEEYYRLLPESSSDEPARRDPGGCGEVRDAPDPEDQEAEWDQAVAQAEQVARKRGALPAGLARAVDETLHPPADWRSVLREFLSSHARNDYSWARPNRRFVSQGLYLPGLHSEELGEVVIAVDTSGSIGKEMLDRFASEVEGILGAFQCSVVVLYHDTEVTGVEEWQPSDGPLRLKPVGGGGTSHVCVFDWLAASGRSPACVVALTDLETTLPSTPPDVEVLWGVIGGTRTAPPFGTVVRLG